MLYIHGATLYTPDNEIPNSLVIVDGNRIISVETNPKPSAPDDSQVIDASGKYLVPGFIDIQFNGGFSDDFTRSPETIWRVGEKLTRFGVSAFLPTIITSPLETIQRAIQVWRYNQPPGYQGAQALGLHLEGPFLNPIRRGAHNPTYMRKPELNDIRNWDLSNGIRLVTLAPELPGALELIKALVERGIVVSAGHSQANLVEAQTAFEAGIRYGTHIFNAMSLLEHRQPGLPGALLDDERLVIGLIADGIHVHPSIVRIIWKSAGSNRVNLVTDAMAALGMAPGRYILGDLEVIVDATSARISEDTLAGSLLSLDQALRNIIKFTGCSLKQALTTLTTTPAGLLGLNHIGRIAVGYQADLVILDNDLHVEQTIISGKIVYNRSYDTVQ